MHPDELLEVRIQANVRHPLKGCFFDSSKFAFGQYLTQVWCLTDR